MVAGLLAGAVLNARAQVASPSPPMRCGSSVILVGQVERILDGRSVVLATGQEVRLAGVEVPIDTDASPSAEAARTALSAMLVGQTVELRGNAAVTPDRYGRTVAYVVTTGESRGRSAAQEMLSAGHARVAAQVDDPARATELLSRERVARDAKRGLWADPQYGITDARNLTDLVAGQGRFAVVEGKVLSVRGSGGTIYVNFGRRWSRALTVTISKRQERIFAGAGLAPTTLANRRLRVRGWVELRNGPRIEASRPEQIEIVELN